MTFNPRIGLPIVVGLVVLNLVGLGYAIASAEPMHAGVHAALVLALGWWARRLRQPPRLGEGALQEEFEALEVEVAQIRCELSEAQERLDFVERLLAEGAEVRRVGPAR